MGVIFNKPGISDLIRLICWYNEFKNTVKRQITNEFINWILCPVPLGTAYG